MMQMIFEWSVRHSSEYKNDSDNIVIDQEKMEWLKKAWDELVVDGQTLIRQIFQVLTSNDTSDEDIIEILLQLSDLLENVDNSIVMQKMNKWDELNDFLQQKIPTLDNNLTDTQKQILTNALLCISVSSQNLDKVQEDIAQSKLKNKIQEILDFIIKQGTDYVNQNIQLVKSLFSIVLNYLQSLKYFSTFNNVKEFIDLLKNSDFNNQQKFKYALERFKVIIQYKENQKQCELLKQLI